MLTSLTPVGEAARKQRWWLTALAYVLGSVAGGGALGALLGGIGGALARVIPVPPVVATGAAVTLVALGLVADAGRFGLRVPSWPRQVNERWLTTYRGWVYGLGFGAQLGVGLATHVVSSAVPLAFATALLSASWRAGALIGLTFGVARSLPLLGTARVRTTASLRRLGRSLADAAPTARRVTMAGQAVAAVTAVAFAVATA